MAKRGENIKRTSLTVKTAPPGDLSVRKGIDKILRRSSIVPAWIFWYKKLTKASDGKWKVKATKITLPFTHDPKSLYTKYEDITITYTPKIAVIILKFQKFRYVIE